MRAPQLRVLSGVDIVLGSTPDSIVLPAGVPIAASTKRAMLVAC